MRYSLNMSRAVAVAALATLAAGVAAPAPAAGPDVPGLGRGDTVRVWDEWAGEAAKAACIAPVDNPLSESHAYAMMSVAVHDALNAIDRRYEPYVYDGDAPPGASVAAAVAAAAHGALVPALLAIPAPFPAECGQAGAAYVEERYAEALAAIPGGPAKDAGVAVGTAAAAAVVALRAGDGSSQPLVSDCPTDTTPGVWQCTPGRPFVFGEVWPDVEPFLLEQADQFLPPPPPSLTSEQYTRDFVEVKRLGGDGTTTPSERSPDQTQVAQFWVESSPLAWNRIARTVSASRHQDDWTAARMFGLLNMALADTYVASFTTKYTYNYWRPVTAIREAAGDGNPATEPDPTWTPLVTTPPIPDYESAHAAQGAAAAAAIRGVLRTDHVSFSACSLTLPAGQTCDDLGAVWRSFRSLSQAARENGDSRVWVGFHFRTAVERGIDLGTSIGDYAVQTQLGRVTGRL